MTQNQRFFSRSLWAGLCFAGMAAWTPLQGNAQGTTPNFESNVLVLEHFTNASCAPCAQQNPGFQSLMRNNPGRAVAVRHHVAWPGLDSMYLANPSDPTARVNYYGITGVPALRLGRFALSPTLSQSTLETWHNVTPANWIYDLETSLLGPGPDSLQISGTVYSLSTPDSNNRLLMVLVEDSIYYPPPGQPGGGLPGNNGERLFPMVTRRILPDTNGISVGSGAVPTNFSFKTRLGARWRLPHLYLTGFVQNGTTKQVHKGFKLRLGYSIHTSVQENLNSGTTNAVQVFPNPANDYAEIRLPASWGASVLNSYPNLQLLDAAGRVQPMTVQWSDPNAARLDLQGVPPGLYYVQIQRKGQPSVYTKVLVTQP
ncbi:MAG: T9SS type A sorting domain-containing protein [Bacteroidia bacterium]